MTDRELELLVADQIDEVLHRSSEKLLQIQTAHAHLHSCCVRSARPPCRRAADIVRYEELLALRRAAAGRA